MKISVTDLQFGRMMQSALPYCATLFALSAGIVWRSHQFDASFFQLLQRLKEKIHASKSVDFALETESDWLQEILISLRTGQSLENSLEQYAESKPPQNLFRRSRAILENNAEDDPISQMLQESIRAGTACTPSLQFLRTAKLLDLRSRRKLRALTLGARLQAIVLALIPWFLLASFFFVDNELSKQLISNPICWAVWITALLLCIAGFYWMKQIVKRGLNPNTLELREREEQLPNILLDLVVLVSSGRDIGESLTVALKKLPSGSKLKIALASFQNKSELDQGPWRALRALIRKAHDQGAPLREELFLLLKELQSQKEARYEELTQKLPLQLLAPLFSCFFLAALLMCFSLMIPFFESF